jgi:hypothetical protein
VSSWPRDQNKSKTEMLVYYKKCVEWESSVIFQNKVHHECGMPHLTKLFY